jgi:hypothetical protein
VSRIALSLFVYELSGRNKQKYEGNTIVNQVLHNLYSPLHTTRRVKTEEV